MVQPPQPQEENQMSQPGAGADDMFGDVDPTAGEMPPLSETPAPGAPTTGPAPFEPLPSEPTGPGTPPLSPDMPPAAIPSVPPLGETTPEPSVSSGVAGPVRSSDRRVGRGSRLRLIILVIVAVVALIAVVATYYVPRLLTNRAANNTETTENINQVSPVETEAVTTNEEAAETTVPTKQVIDSDGDGLLDSEEGALGTDPELLDTDGDGLNDRQEVEIYKSDPTDTDSDNDGFKDGEEVRNFFNPVGPGKLLNVNEAIEEFTSETTQ
ncbi:hypothetical protein ACFL2M_01900 [Patescibacteria group bacterium]